MYIPWGKYKGEQVCNVPSSYLCWMLENASNLYEGLREAIEREMAERFGTVHEDDGHEDGCERCRTVRDVFRAGYRRVAAVVHPDRNGGDDRAMKALNNLFDDMERACLDGERQDRA